MDDDEFDIEEDDSEYSDSSKSGMDKLLDIFNENKKLIIIVGVIILLLIIMSLFTNSSSKSIKISETERTITTSSGVQLKLLVDNHETSNGVTWESSNPSIATVDNNGSVRGLSVGKVTITANYDNKKYKCEITVSGGDAGISVSSVKFPEGSLIMTVGSSYTPIVEIEPSDAKIINKVFSVSDTSVASVNLTTGMVTANKAGTAMLRVAVNNGT